MRNQSQHIYILVTKLHKIIVFGPKIVEHKKTIYNFSPPKKKSQLKILNRRTNSSRVAVADMQ